MPSLHRCYPYLQQAFRGSTMDSNRSDPVKSIEDLMMIDVFLETLTWCMAFYETRAI